MEAPTSVKIWVPSSHEAFDATAEPTLEDQNGSDILAAAIADTEQAINVMDGRPGQQLTVDTSGERSTFRIDLEANLRKTYDALMVDNHNLLSAYPLSIRDLLNIYKYTADDDALANATEVSITKIMSGLLGKERPRLNFDGIANRAEKDSVTILPSTYPFMFEVIFKTTSTASQVLFSISDKDSDIEYCTVGMTAAGLIDLAARSGGVFKHAYSAAAYNDGEWHHVFAEFTDATDRAIYVDDAADGTNTDACPLDLGTDRISIGRLGRSTAGNYFNGSIEMGKLWNRILTSTERTARYNGWSHTPTPIADQSGSDTGLLANSGFEAGGTGGDFDGGTEVDDGATDIFTSWGNENVGTGKIEATATKAFGNYAVKITTGNNANIRVFQAESDVENAGKKMRLSFWTRGDGTYDARYRVHDFTNGVDIIAVVGTGVTGTSYTLFEKEFDVPATCTNVVIYLYGNATDTAVVYFDAAALIQIGCVAEYNHDGISAELGKWLDASGNDLHCTITGCEYMDTPDDDNLGFYLTEFTAVVDYLFWFLQFVQNDGATNASADTLLGWLPLMKSYTFGDLIAGGYTGEQSYGIDSRVSDVGRVLTEEIHDEQPRWSLRWNRLTAAQWVNLKEMLQVIRPGPEHSLLPFYICFNYDADDPVIWRVRMMGGLSWEHNTQNTYKWSPSMELIRDL